MVERAPKKKEEDEVPHLIDRSQIVVRKTKGKTFRANLLDGKYTISASSIRRLEKELMEKKEEVSR